MLRYLNMFVLIGVALIGISIAGFATGNRFLIEPGQAPNRYASLIYLGAGVLMLINGAVSIRYAPAPRPSREPKQADRDTADKHDAAKTAIRP